MPRTSSLIHRLRRLLKGEIIAVGSVRRGSTTPKDRDFIVVSRRPPFATLSNSRNARGGDRHFQIVLLGVAVDLFWVRPAEKPWALFHWTGPRSYNIRVRAHALRRGLKLNQYGLFHRATGRRVRGSRVVRTERNVCKLLGVTYRPPEERK